MEKTKGLPEEAQKEPRILSNDEDTERAKKRLDWQDDHPEVRHWPQNDDPLRQPGELSPPPDRKT